MALEGTIKTPFGEMKKKTALIAGGGVVGLAGIVWYRNKQNAAANAAATTNAATDAANQTNIDPATGFPYGSAEDSAALAQQQGIQYTPYGGGGPFPSGGSPYPTTGPPFTTNWAWATYCEQTMGSTGSDQIAAALGKYLTGAPVTPDMVTIIQQAIAIGGYPPTAGPNGFPPSMNTQPGGDGGQNVTVPNVIGMETAAGDRKLTAAGLKFSHPPLEPGIGSIITSESPNAGTKVPSGTTIKLGIKEKEKR